jgi:hypothetical protein
LIQGVLDTGAPWCVLNPELADAWKLVPEDAYMPASRLNIRGTPYPGHLVTVPLEIHTDIGENLAVSATIFIPTLDPGEIWDAPNFIGLNGFLERIRFAVDAMENAFYFGPADI